MSTRVAPVGTGWIRSRCFALCGSIAASAAAAVLAACSSVPDRNPIPEELGDVAVVPGIPLESRFWGDLPPPWLDSWLAASNEELEGRFGGIMDREHAYLAVSGGGQNGAYGAGLLVGWTELGTRPEFTMVTGISTGALTAPFAFLGSDYDDRLRKIYTSYSTEDLVDERGKLAVLTNDAVTDSAPLLARIREMIDAEMIAAIGAEFARGRQLQIMTTHLDAGRPITWNVTRIAASDAPNKVDLIHHILLASASIPGVMPPVMFEVEAGGATYDEMHVDGGTMSQVFLYPAGLDWRDVEERLRVKGAPKAYVIRNSQLRPIWTTVERRTLPIVARSVDSMLRTQGIGDLYRIYLQALEDSIEFHLAYVPDDFEHESKEFFDAEYMRALFDVGYQQMLTGDPWKRAPLGFEGRARP